MSDEFILCIGDSKFLMCLDEAMQIASLLNASQTVGTEWLKDVPQGRNHVLKRPHLMSAVVAPMTAIFRMELETNQRVLDEKK